MDETTATDLITKLCTDRDICEVEDILSEHFNNVRFVDEKIDDLIPSEDEDSEDDYLMMRSYDVDNFYVRFYYPRTTCDITDIEVSLN